MCCGKVNVILIGVVVNTSHEVYAAQVPVVPPVPSHLTRLNPVGRAYLVLTCKGIYHVVEWHLGLVLGYGQYTPRIAVGAFITCNVVFGLLYIRHATPTVIVHGFGVGGKLCFEAAIVGADEHSGIAHYV